VAAKWPRNSAFICSPYQLTMNATIVALPLALAKSLKAEPVVSGCRFAAPYFPMTHLNAHVSGDRVAAAYQRSVLRSQERLG
jgi:hypothetical protein